MKFIKNCDEPFIIAEVGQNHQGDVEIAKKFINQFAKAGADAIKFQTRDLDSLFSKDALNREYDNPNSFGETYGEHRRKLELSLLELKALKKECDLNNVLFMSTPFDEESLENLCKLDVKAIKVASFDIGNIPFLEKIAKKNILTFMSIGGGNSKQINSSVRVFEKYNTQLVILHCVSEYPCEYNKLGLNNITKLKDDFPSHIIGLSDHFNGILSGPIGYTKGARVFEKHVTLNRSWKGTDHNFALELDGFRKFVRDIKRVRHMYDVKDDGSLGNEPVFKKLGKSVVARKDINKNELLTVDNLSGKIFKNIVIPVRDVGSIIGKKVKNHIREGHTINYDDCY